MSKGYVPLNTEKKHSLGPACFSQWKSARNKSVAVEVVGKGNIYISLWLCKYTIYYPAEVSHFMASRDIKSSECMYIHAIMHNRKLLLLRPMNHLMKSQVSVYKKTLFRLKS